MSLVELVDNTRTDKNTTHSYLDLYQELLEGKKDTATHVLEVGIGDGNQGITDGGSIKLWRDFFTQATVYALDIKHIDAVWDGIKNDDRITLYTSINAYTDTFVRETFTDKDIRFDFVIDDGPHTLESMQRFIQLYLPLLKDDGLLIIEDVQHLSWLDSLAKIVPESMQKFIVTYDLRFNKSRHDDIVFTVNKKAT